VKLTVDHVTPVALGGSDDPTNLVTACADCNGGKSSIAPDSAIVADVAADALRWADAMRQAAGERAITHLQDRALEDNFRSWWDLWTWTDPAGRKHQIEPAADWRQSVRQFVVAGLGIEDLLELTEVAMTARVSDEWKYFCGCCWTRVKQTQERAAEILANGEL
jgi:hypothetical protein